MLQIVAGGSRFDVAHLLKSKLRGVDLAVLANAHGVTITKDGKINKGWVGQTIDRVAETQGINAAKPDGVDFELKSVIGNLQAGEWVPKETFAITMLNPTAILTETFEDSRLWHKLERLILIGHSYEGDGREHARVSFVMPVDVTDMKLHEDIRSFWTTIRQIVAEGRIATYSSKGTSAGFVQLRTKGSGGSTSRCPITGESFKTRAFYATKNFVRYVRGNL
jgi:DNA mismatch repair protein MutH